MVTNAEGTEVLIHSSYSTINHQKRTEETIDERKDNVSFYFQIMQGHWKQIALAHLSTRILSEEGTYWNNKHLSEKKKICIFLNGNVH